MLDALEKSNLESNRSCCKDFTVEIPTKDINRDAEVINMKNSISSERGRMINMPGSQNHTLLCTYSSSQSVKAVGTLCD